MASETALKSTYMDDSMDSVTDMEKGINFIISLQLCGTKQACISAISSPFSDGMRPEGAPPPPARAFEGVPECLSGGQLLLHRQYLQSMASLRAKIGGKDPTFCQDGDRDFSIDRKISEGGSSKSSEK